MRTAATLLIAAALAACMTHDNPASPPSYTDAELAEFMGTREERAARAPYSPEGWPLRRGDVITWGYRNELFRQFPVWDNAGAAFWIGETVFGAYFTHVKGTLDKAIYHGHFREKTTEWPPWDALPEHLRGRDLGELKRSLYTRLGGPMVPTLEMAETWTVDAWLDGFTGEGLDQP